MAEVLSTGQKKFNPTFPNVPGKGENLIQTTWRWSSQGERFYTHAGYAHILGLNVTSAVRQM